MQESDSEESSGSWIGEEDGALLELRSDDDTSGNLSLKKKYWKEKK